MTDWEPRDSDIEWVKDLIRILKDGGIWVPPAMGFFTIDKQAKTFTMTAKTPEHDAELFERTVKACKAIGYTVVDETGE